MSTGNGSECFLDPWPFVFERLVLVIALAVGWSVSWTVSNG